MIKKFVLWYLTRLANRADFELICAERRVGLDPTAPQDVRTYQNAKSAAKQLSEFLKEEIEDKKRKMP